MFPLPDVYVENSYGLLDIYTISRILLAKKKATSQYNPIKLYENLFHDYYFNENHPHGFPSESACIRRLSAQRSFTEQDNTLIEYYQAALNDPFSPKNVLSSDIQKILSNIDHYYEMTLGIFELLMLDTSIRTKDKHSILNIHFRITPEKVPLPMIEEGTLIWASNLLSHIIYFCISSHFIKRNAKGVPIPFEDNSIISAITNDIPDVTLPFYGRDDILPAIAQALTDKGKVFLTGNFGIGKCETAIYFIEQYSHRYKNILYFPYSGSLKDIVQNIPCPSNMWAPFPISTGYQPELMDYPYGMDSVLLLEKNKHFLQTFSKETLIVVSKLDSIPPSVGCSQQDAASFYMTDDFLPFFLSLGADVLFTSPCDYSLSSIPSIEIGPLDTDTLYKIFSDIFYNSEQHKTIIKQIIQCVDRNTFITKLIATQLQKSVYSPRDALNCLKSGTLDLGTSESIPLKKSGKWYNLRFYEHIKNLFKLNGLSHDLTNVLMLLSLIALPKIKKSDFVELTGLNDCNAINTLVSLGFIDESKESVLSINSSMAKVVLKEYPPNVENCAALIRKFKDLCTQTPSKSSIVTRNCKIIDTILSHMDLSIPNDTHQLQYVSHCQDFLDFLQNAYPYALSAKKDQTAQHIVDSMQSFKFKLSKTSEVDRVVFLLYKKLQQRAGLDTAHISCADAAFSCLAAMPSILFDVYAYKAITEIVIECIKERHNFSVSSILECVNAYLRKQGKSKTCCLLLSCISIKLSQHQKAKEILSPLLIENKEWIISIPNDTETNRPDQNTRLTNY